MQTKYCTVIMLQSTSHESDNTSTKNPITAGSKIASPLVRQHVGLGSAMMGSASPPGPEPAMLAVKKITTTNRQRCCCPTPHPQPTIVAPVPRAAPPPRPHVARRCPRGTAPRTAAPVSHVTLAAAAPLPRSAAPPQPPSRLPRVPQGERGIEGEERGATGREWNGGRGERCGREREGLGKREREGREWIRERGREGWWKFFSIRLSPSVYSIIRR